MRPDIVNLRQFYSSPLGRKVKRRLRNLVRHYWGHPSGLHMVGVGYTTDILPLPDAPAHSDSRIIALMPMAQGGIYWPIDGMNHSVLSDELCPPFMPTSLHRVVMLHGFEHHPSPEDLLRVWWKLLVPGGRLMLIVPNRRGLWVRLGRTPFTSGASYTTAALKELCNRGGFSVRATHSALFAPPSTHPLWLRCFGVIEWVGTLLFPHMGGVVVMEAEKQIYAGVREPLRLAKAASKWKNAPALNPSRDSHIQNQ
jgi:SAM-dependent methyltransferase